MADIKPYIEYLIEAGIGSDEAKTLLGKEKCLTVDQKNRIYMYCYPRTLLDRELPKRILDYRMSVRGNDKGTLEEDPGEVSLILEATRTEQYSRFMKHLMHAFKNPEEIHPVQSTTEMECPICGKHLVSIDNWNSTTDPTRETIAFGSEDSGIVLCLDCLMNLIRATEVLNSLDEGILDWTKRGTLKKCSWEDVKL